MSSCSSSVVGEKEQIPIEFKFKQAELEKRFMKMIKNNR